MLSWSVCSFTVIVHIVSNRQTRPTQQQQLHLSGRLLAVFSEVLVYHFGSLRGSLVLGAHRAAHGSARTTSLPQMSRKKGRASVQMPSGCASNGGGVPVSTEAQTQPWAEFWPTWLKSHRCSSVRTSKIPQNHLGFNWGLLCPGGHARRRMCRIHPCASAPVRSVLAWWRTRGDCCSCRRWRSPEFPHSPPTTVLRWADVTRTTWLDSPIKSWWDAHAVARPEPIKLEAPEAGYEVRCGKVQ